MSLSKNTYGDSPAALYLVRVLNEYNNSAVTRSVGKRITASSKCVNELVEAYQLNAMSAKSVANCLRLMRAEVSMPCPVSAPSPDRLIDQLTRNVQIGLIKKAMRLCTIARKAERVMENPDKRSANQKFSLSTAGVAQTLFEFKDSESGKTYTAGRALMFGTSKPCLLPKTFKFEDVQDVTAEILMERSDRRCKRLGKPHMENV